MKPKLSKANPPPDDAVPHSGSAIARLRTLLRLRMPAERAWNYWTLSYLLFLFINWAQSPLAQWLPPTLLSLAIFLPLYLHAQTRRGRRTLLYSVAFAMLGFALTPFNTSANTYLIYASVMLPFSGLALRSSIAIIVAGLALYALELALLNYPMRFLLMMIAMTAIISIAICAANHFHREKQLRQAELKLSHDEVRRLAGLAERERIGRDLHDLLGHTLSLITLKSELAVRLFDRDPLAARREVLDVERVAREALGQVRRAVSGIRTAGLAAELASARLLLESSDTHLDYTPPASPLPSAIETVLALAVREAVTNIQRHARASSARIAVNVDSEHVRLEIEDNGRASRTIVPGNGLCGMRERLQALGGDLEIRSALGQGTRLLARLPLDNAAFVAAKTLAT